MIYSSDDCMLGRCGWFCRALLYDKCDSVVSVLDLCIAGGSFRSTARIPSDDSFPMLVSRIANVKTRWSVIISL